MRKIAVIFCLLVVGLCMACHKEDEKVLPTDMRVKVDNDTAMITTNVTTTNGTGVVYINGVTNDGSRKVELAITGYAGKKNIFVIDYRGPGGNMTGNTLVYKNGAELVNARSGNITITSVETDIIKGTFDAFYQQMVIRGSFTAPRER